jgi:hypothetical protein
MRPDDERAAVAEGAARLEATRLGRSVRGPTGKRRLDRKRKGGVRG